MNQFLINKDAPEYAFKASLGTVSSSVEDGSFSMSAYKKGQIFAHPFWGRLMFSVEGMSINKKKVPVTVDHDTSKGCGYANSFEIGDSVKLDGKFAKNQHADYVKSMGGGMECSLQFEQTTLEIEFIEYGESGVVDGITVEGPLVVFSKSEIIEVAFTLLGAVPSTTASFKSFLQPPISKEIIMADVPNQADVRASVEKELQTKFTKMSEMCSDEKFVVACFSKGIYMEQFSAELLKKQGEEIVSFKAEVETLKAENAELKAKLESEGPAPASFGVSENKVDEPKNYMEAIAQFKAKGQDHATAMVSAAKGYPSLYKTFSGR